MKKYLSSVLIAIGITFFGVAQVPTYAATCSGPKDCITKGANSADTGSKSNDAGIIVKTITNALLFVLGAVSVIMIVIGGLRYTTSNGDEARIKTAKNTILYAVIGLVVAILAYAIVRFVINALT